MKEVFDIRKFDEYREDNRREVKKAEGGLPRSLWETYSAMANCSGGVIILGAEENSDGSWKSTGLKKENEGRLLRDFWNLIHNEQKVSDCIISDDDIEVYDANEEDIIIVLHVPMAEREIKPIYINGDIFAGSFRRNNEGDYHCTRQQVKAMLRDQTENTADMKVLDEMMISSLN